jgi:hypothetical protein
MQCRVMAFSPRIQAGLLPTIRQLVDRRSAIAMVFYRNGLRSILAEIAVPPAIISYLRA